MFSAILRGATSSVRRVAKFKSRIPFIKDIGVNFILLHYIYIISFSFITSIIIYPGSELAYIDALFFSAGAATQSGLNTVDFNLLHTYQQVVLYFVSMLTTPIFIHTVLVFVRLYWFEKRFQHVARDARALRQTRSRARTVTADKDTMSYDREEQGIRGRSIVVLRNTLRNQGTAEEPPTNDVPPQPSDSGTDTPNAPDDSPDDAPGDAPDDTPDDAPDKSGRTSEVDEGTEGYGDGDDDVTPGSSFRRRFSSLRVPAQLSPEQHIAFLENQRRDTSALRIPSPREYERGGVPEILDEEAGGEVPKITRTVSDGSIEAGSPRDVDEHNENENDNVGPMVGPHVTINEPDMGRTRTRNSTFPRMDTRPTVRETKDIDNPSPLGRTTTRRPTFTGVFRSLTQERDRTTLPYLSWNATVGRNSNFVDLTEEQRDELGGIEYRALKTLAVVLISYYVFFHLLGIICLIPWIMTTRWGEVVTTIGQGRPWWAIFTAGSSFNDVGFTITPDSMVSFQDAVFPLLLMTFLIIIGNTAFPCMLRLIIWALSKVARKETPLWEELKFLLDHPRRCFTLLFPRNATWWLFAIVVALNVIDLIFFIILDLNNPVVTNLPKGIRVLDGLFQAASTRTAGFSVVPLGDVHPAVQVSYMIMMYISVFPIAISLRRTNVYEEKSLGIYPAADDEDTSASEENHNAPSYIGAHLRRQLGFDLWYVVLGLFIISIVEGGRLQRKDEYAFQIWSVLFEVISAYGTVGLSLGYPGVNASFVSQFQVLSKLVIIAMQVRGRHRGLPYALDRAILLPSEALNQKEIADAEKRMRRRASSLAQTSTFDYAHTQPREDGVSSGLDPKDAPGWGNESPMMFRRQSTLRSQVSQQ